ncbi:hypothetical protein DBR11_09620 [Pedobacter sp. HMWF019]|uniref:TonB-dependent receptor n=1 Tax=Pedobacter sp. HMWF019 TaxID=2056856 RepID=UPI000D3B34A4|nr:TonB-dependent receptor [Pedobacter sp. HMWF019]PTT00534.1 hypothetical protein DBR11_09620 [Pedobacter sp. HMWF019]
MKALLLFAALLYTSAFAQKKQVFVQGKVIDSKNRPIEFATIQVSNGNFNTYTDASGLFSIPEKLFTTDYVTISISFTGKQSLIQLIRKADFPHNFVLLDQSLTLDEVNVSARRTNSNTSNSAITFDRQAIEQVQAYSLADIMNNLPGKRMSAPDLQYLQSITLRSAATAKDPVQAANNALGVAIYVDGFRQANDANMQTRNVGLRGMIGGAIGNRKDPNVGSPSYDAPFGGLDIRNIPADNIESIEVVSGVASAKYGEITDGAIIINRKAGKTPYEFSMRLNGSSTNYSISKGLYLGEKAGALNYNFNYLNSIQNPTDNLKNYKRYTGGLMWSTYLISGLKNTLSVDYSYKIDNARIDPDDDRQEQTYSIDRKFSFSNRSVWQVNKPYLQNISFGTSYDIGYSNSYTQYYMNGAVKLIADKDTTGIYEGYYGPGNYFAIDHIIGKPYNFSTSVDLNNQFNTGKISHSLSLGFNYYTSGNNGQGIIADPNTPPIGIGSGSLKSERPYRFDLQGTINNFGFYLQDQARYKLFNRILTTNLGMRYDLQNGYASIQPRINTSYQISSKWAIRAAYGISTKAPGMAQRYPAPTYFDIPLINAYYGSVNESLYLVYTQKNVHDNSFLKPSLSTQFELGASADYGFINTSVYGYLKKNRDGFNTALNYIQLLLPEYSFTKPEGGKPVYQQTGTFKMYSGLSESLINNAAQSDNYGVEWFLSTKKIAAIQTSVNMSTSFSYSRSNDLGYSIAEAGQSFREQGRPAWYGIYEATKSSNLDITTKITTDTHIPKLGFVVSLSADIYWKNQSKVLDKNTEPIAYLDKNYQYHPITNFDPDNYDYGFLATAPSKATNISNPPFVYTNLSLRIAKEMKKKIRIAVYAYNFLNIIPQYYNSVTNSFSTYNSPVNVGGEISFKF